MGWVVFVSCMAANPEKSRGFAFSQLTARNIRRCYCLFFMRDLSRGVRSIEVCSATFLQGSAYLCPLIGTVRRWRIRMLRPIYASTMFEAYHNFFTLMYEFFL